MTRLLALFDVDGTLFLTHDPLASEALLGTLRELYPVDPADDAVERIDHSGQTAKRIARLVLRAEGAPDEVIDAQLDAWCGAFAERYVELLGGADSRGWRAAPGANEELRRLAASGVQLALLTGNPEPMARARIERLGLDRFFPPGQGAFGCDAESRVELIELARARAGDWPADGTVELGDTSRDEESATAAGIRSIRVDEAGLRAAADRLLAWSES